jgi:hypothetical protein
MCRLRGVDHATLASYWPALTKMPRESTNYLAYKEKKGIRDDWYPRHADGSIYKITAWSDLHSPR